MIQSQNPPNVFVSGVKLLYAWVGQLSVLRCFLATLLPGIILTVMLIVVNFVVFALQHNHSYHRDTQTVFTAVNQKDLDIDASDIHALDYSGRYLRWDYDAFRGWLKI